MAPSSRDIDHMEVCRGTLVPTGGDGVPIARTSAQRAGGGFTIKGKVEGYGYSAMFTRPG